MREHNLYALHDHSAYHLDKRLAEARRDRLAPIVTARLQPLRPLPTLRVARLLVIAMILLAMLLQTTGAAAQTLPPGGITPNPMPIQYVGVPQQLLSDAGFENPFVGSTRAAPWVLANMNITGMPSKVEPFGHPHCGSWVMATGGHWLTYAGVAFAFQQVTIPASAAQPVLTFYLLVRSSVPQVMRRTTADALSVNISTGTPDGYANDNYVATLASFDNWTTTRDAWLHEGNYDLSAYRGQTIQVWFNVSIDTDAPLTTDYYIDDVGVWTLPPNTPPC